MKPIATISRIPEISDDTKEQMKDIIEVKNEAKPKILNDSYSNGGNYFIPEIVLKSDPENDNDIELLDHNEDWSHPNAELFNDDLLYSKEK